MRFLGVHPGPLLYTKVFLRLEPLGLELVAAAARQAGHQVRLIDLQVEDHRAYFRMHRALAAGYRRVFLQLPGERPRDRRSRQRRRKRASPASLSASAVTAPPSPRPPSSPMGRARSIACSRARARRRCRFCSPQSRPAATPITVPGAVTAAGEGPPPGFVHSLDELSPARDLLRHRRKYFIGTLDPCASIEFSRGCPWDCSFCSAWTFYGRSYRLVSTERVVEDLRSIREPGIFIVDDVAFIHERHGLEIGEAIARAGIKKTLLPRNPRRRAVAQQGGVSTVGAARVSDDVSRPRSDRRGGAQEIPQAGRRSTAISRRSNSPARSASMSRST